MRVDKPTIADLTNMQHDHSSAAMGGLISGAGGVGTAGQVLTSNGVGLLPTFQAAGGGSGNRLVARIVGFVVSGGGGGNPSTQTTTILSFVVPGGTLGINDGIDVYVPFSVSESGGAGSPGTTNPLVLTFGGVTIFTKDVSTNNGTAFGSLKIRIFNNGSVITQFSDSVLFGPATVSTGIATGVNIATAVNTAVNQTLLLQVTTTTGNGGRVGSISADAFFEYVPLT